MISLKPHTEVPLLLDCLKRRGAQRLPVFRTLHHAWQREAASLQVHPDITPEDLSAFSSMMYALEEPVEIPFSEEDLWHTHGAFYWFQTNVRPSCLMTAGIMDRLSRAVGDLPHPPR